jgi:hypothetical protein
MGNNIDDIFKRAIEPLDTEPSEEFWRKAAEDIIAKGSKATEKRIFRWRAIAFVLGAGLVVLGYFTYRMQSSLEHANQQMKVVENDQNKQVDKLTENTIAKNEDNTTLKTIASKNKVTSHKQNTSIATKVVPEYHPVVASQVPAVVNSGHHTSASSPVSYVSANHTKISLATNYKKSAIRASHKPVDATSLANQKNNAIVSVANNENNNLENSSVQEKTYAFVKPSSQSADSITKQDDTSDSANDVVEQADQVTGLPPLSTNAQNNKPTVNDSASKLNISVFFSPDNLVGYGFNSPYSWGSQIENAIKQGEKEKFSYTTGAKVEYAISSNFTIGAGIAYEEYSFNVNPGTVYAQRQSDGDIGYYFTTSSGVVECPSYGHTALNDSIKMNASSTRKYLQVPLLAKYFLVNTKKLRFYVVGGLEPCFNLGDNTVMNWQNYWGEGGTVSASNMEGSRNFYFSYYVGIGATYKVGNHLSIYIEPGLHNAVTPIDDQIAVTTSPKLFSASVGLTYTVK